ncbi:unnamed protein product, partial [Symbiodinium pilosum]
VLKEGGATEADKLGEVRYFRLFVDTFHGDGTPREAKEALQAGDYVEVTIREVSLGAADAAEGGVDKSVDESADELLEQTQVDESADESLEQTQVEELQEEDKTPFQIYIPDQDLKEMVEEGVTDPAWPTRIVRAYIPNTTWTLEWIYLAGDEDAPPMDYAFLDRVSSKDPDTCRGKDFYRGLRKAWWKSTFAVANASDAADFAARILGAKKDV